MNEYANYLGSQARVCQPKTAHTGPSAPREKTPHIFPSTPLRDLSFDLRLLVYPAILLGMGAVALWLILQGVCRTGAGVVALSNDGWEAGIALLVLLASAVAVTRLSPLGALILIALSPVFVLPAAGVAISACQYARGKPSRSLRVRHSHWRCHDCWLNDSEEFWRVPAERTRELLQRTLGPPPRNLPEFAPSPSQVRHALRRAQKLDAHEAIEWCRARRLSLEQPAVHCLLLGDSGPSWRVVEWPGDLTLVASQTGAVIFDSSSGRPVSTCRLAEPEGHLTAGPISPRLVKNGADSRRRR